MTLLLSLLILTLSRSRERALAMVAEKTGQLRHQAMHDALTGLPNRVLAIDRAEQMLARARRADQPIAVLYIDIDGFKHINDTFGHAVGDTFLKAVAARLETVVRAGDTAARLAGDEFVVLLEASTLDAGPELVAERVLDVLREPYDLTEEIGRELSVTASIGVAYGQHETAEELLADADVALYAAKEAGRNQYVDLRVRDADRRPGPDHAGDGPGRRARRRGAVPRLPADLRPQVRAHHRRRGAAALAPRRARRHRPRRLHPDRRAQRPDPVDRALGAAHRHPPGRDVARPRATSSRSASTCRAASSTTTSSSTMCAAPWRESGLKPSALTVEITETALMKDPEATARRLNAIKALGVRVAVDDFGTGYSSLAYLRQFPVDTLKIDRAFVQGIASSKESAALIQTLIDLGKSLNLETLGEGIEDLAQLEHLQRARCDSGQGFLFARPLEADALTEFLSSRPADQLPAGADL